MTNPIVISSIFSSNSEAFASELLENIEEIFLRYFMHNAMFRMYHVVTTFLCFLCLA